jgi:hypothetical protein
MSVAAGFAAAVDDELVVLAAAGGFDAVVVSAGAAPPNSACSALPFWQFLQKLGLKAFGSKCPHGSFPLIC